MAEDVERCIRCGSSEHFEPVRLIREFDKDGKHYFEYEVKCNKCGRVDPYVSLDANLINPRTVEREQLEAEGRQKQALAGKVDPSSIAPTADELQKQAEAAKKQESKKKISPKPAKPAPKHEVSPLDADWEARKAAGLDQ